MNTKNVKRATKKTPAKTPKKLVGSIPNISVPGVGNFKCDDHVHFAGGIIDVQNQMFLHNDPNTVPDGLEPMKLTNNQLAILCTVIHPHAPLCIKNDDKWPRKFQFNGVQRCFFDKSHMVGARRDFYRGKHGKNSVQLFAENGDPLTPTIFTGNTPEKSVEKLTD